MKTCRPAQRSLAEAFKPVEWRSDGALAAATGLVALPFNRETLSKDLLASNGNDVASQPLAIYFYDPLDLHVPRFKEPDWLSDRRGFHGFMSAGHLDADDHLDVAVSLLQRAGGRSGGLTVYRGSKGCSDGSESDKCSRDTLEMAPSFEVSGFNSTTTSLGDVNLDGWLDVAVAAFSPSRPDPPEQPVAAPAAPAHGPERWPWRTFPRREDPEPNVASPSRPSASVPGCPSCGPWRIYLNQLGSLVGADAEVARELQPRRPQNASEIELADVNLDGLLDLVVGWKAVEVFYGRWTSAGVRFGRADGRANWTSDPLPAGRVFISSIDTGARSLGSDATSLLIAAGTTCLFEDRPCPGGLVVYDPVQDTKLLDFDFGGRAGEVRLRDVDGDCDADLVATAWSDWDGTRHHGSRLRIFRGDGTDFEDDPWTSDEESPFIGEAIAFADFGCEDVDLEVATFKAPGGALVVTLADSSLEVVRRVFVTPPGGLRRELERGKGEFTFAVDEPWIAFRDLDHGSIVEVEYTRSPTPDVAVATFDKGVWVFERKRTGESPTCNPQRNEEIDHGR